MSNRVEQVADHTPLVISDRDFRRLSEFVHQNYGIDLSQKQQLISGRLSTVVKQKGYRNFTEFIDHMLTTKSQEDLTLLLNKLTTNYTFFMREMGSWDYFRDTIIPEIVQKHRKDKSLAIWSAGCSSGEEPYNISMYLLDYLGSHAKEWDTRVLATDISERALASAKRGIYQLPDTVPADWKQKYFVPTQGDEYSVAPALKNNVIFQTFNLMSPIKFRTKFDVIFCRNVMIYFNQQTKDALVRRFYDASNQGGYFLIGCSENIGSNIPYRKVSTAVYRKI